jgi:hypothetical protein
MRPAQRAQFPVARSSGHRYPEHVPKSGSRSQASLINLATSSGPGGCMSRWTTFGGMARGGRIGRRPSPLDALSKRSTHDGVNLAHTRRRQRQAAGTVRLMHRLGSVQLWLVALAGAQWSKARRARSQQRGQRPPCARRCA